MRTISLSLGIIAVTSLMAQGTWLQRSSLAGGAARWGTTEFVIDGIGYVVGGYTGTTDLNEVWAYDPESDTWQAKAPIPGVRRLASAFTIGGKGYVTCGLYNTFSKYNDLWEYDPIANTWTQRASVPAAERYGSSTFVLNGIGYLVCGNLGSATGPYSAELWAYDPVADNWTAKAGLPDQARYAARCFETGGQAFLYGGRLVDQTFSPGLWSYDPITNAWSSKASLPAIPRTFSYVWSLPDRAILMGGNDLGLSDLHDCWSYNPVANAWSPLAAYAGTGVWGGASMAINGRVYAGLGRYGSDSASDLWELRDAFVGVVEQIEVGGLSVGPNPIRNGGTLSISWSGTMQSVAHELVLFDVQGHEVFRRAVNNATNTSLTLPTLPAGNYLTTLRKEGVTLDRTILTILD